MKFSLNGKRVLIFGGTGSLGKTLIKRLLEFEIISVATFSRDEAKKVIINQMFPKVETFIGDVRDYDSVERAIFLYRPNVIINAAALKNVPEGEEFPFEFVKTNVLGTQNVVRACEKFDTNLWHNRVLSISTDKAAKPINAYGMSKALQEKIHLNGRGSLFNVVRYGNVLESRGSVIPFFKSLIEQGKDLPVTHQDMTRFFLSLDESVDLIFRALECEETRKIFIPKVKSARIWDLAEIMAENSGKAISPQLTSIRPGEKINEILISEEEMLRCEERENVSVIYTPNVKIKNIEKKLLKGMEEYSSNESNVLMSKEQLKVFLKEKGILS